MKRISLSNSKEYFALVDEEDYARVISLKWRLIKGAYGDLKVMKTTRPYQYLHQFIMGNPPAGLEWDHENRCGLDNRRRNLRPSSKSQNNYNKGKRKDNSSGFKGVYWNTGNGRWRAQIRFDHRWKHLGYFDTPEEAARSYDDAAKRYHGENFAGALNFPEIKRLPRLRYPRLPEK